MFKTWPKNLNNNSEYKYLLFCYWKDLSILFQNLNSFKGSSTPLGWDLHTSPNFSYLEVRNSSTDSNWKWQKKGSILGGKSTFKYIHCTAEIDNQIWRYEHQHNGFKLPCNEPSLKVNQRVMHRLSRTHNTKETHGKTYFPLISKLNYIMVWKTYSSFYVHVYIINKSL